MFHLCTYFDRRYLVYGLALYRSLMRWAGQEFTLHVLCLDDASFQGLRALSSPRIRLIRLPDLEHAYPSLLIARANRSLLEYYFTLTPALLCYVLKQNPGIELLAYVDADIYFYSRPDPIYEELGAGSILLVPHRAAHGVEGGTYNVGLLLFRNDEAGRACVNWWRERCTEWCFNRYEDGKCADQGYLEGWPSKFSGVVVSQHKGIGLAPWNAGRYTLRLKDGTVFVDSDRLIFYHFGNVRMVRSYLFTHDLPAYNTRMTPALKNLVYAPYLRELRSSAADAQIAVLPPLGSEPRGSFTKWLRRELFVSRLVVVGGLVIDMNYGPLGPLLGKIRKRWFA